MTDAGVNVRRYSPLLWKSIDTGLRMLILVASVVALVLGIAVMPWRARQPAHEFRPELVVTIVAGCTLMGLGFGGAVIGAVILLIQ